MPDKSIAAALFGPEYLISTVEELGEFIFYDKLELFYKTANAQIDFLPPGGYVLKFLEGEIIDAAGANQEHYDIEINSRCYKSSIKSLQCFELCNNKVTLKFIDGTMGSIKLAVYRYTPRHLWHYRREAFSGFLNKNEIENYLFNQRK